MSFIFNIYYKLHPTIKQYVKFEFYIQPILALILYSYDHLYDAYKQNLQQKYNPQHQNLAQDIPGFTGNIIKMEEREKNSRVLRRIFKDTQNHNYWYYPNMSHTNKKH